MKHIPLLSAFYALLLFSCSGNPAQNQAQQETPKALEDKNPSYEMSSKRGYEDLVAELYYEQVSKDNELKALEDNLNTLSNSKGDSTRAFENFNDKNKRYFSAAKSHIDAITDSLLRDKMERLLADQMSKYNALTAVHTDLLKRMDEKQVTLNDLHNLLMVVKTLPLIANYQQHNLPGTRPMENYIRQQDVVIKMADTLSKK